MKNGTIVTRLLIGFVMLWGVAWAGAAQELRVRDVQMLATDLTAGVHPRTDLNGKVCALIKVVTPLAGMAFEGNLIGEPLNKTGEYWVYVTDNTRFLKIKHPQYEPLMVDFDNFLTERPKSKITYELRLQATAPQQPQQQSNKRLVYSSGDQVFSCDGIYRYGFGEGKDDWEANRFKNFFETNPLTINRKHFALSFDFCPDANLDKAIEDGVYSDGPYKGEKRVHNDYRHVITMGDSWRIISIYLNKDGYIQVITNQSNIYNTPLQHRPNEWKSLDIEYDHGTLTINGHKIENVYINPIDDTSELSSLYYASGGAFLGRLANIRYWTFDEE